MSYENVQLRRTAPMGKFDGLGLSGRIYDLGFSDLQA